MEASSGRRPSVRSLRLKVRTLVFLAIRTTRRPIPAETTHHHRQARPDSGHEHRSEISLDDTDCPVSYRRFWCHLDAVARLAICRGTRGAVDGPRVDTAHGVVANHHRSGIDAIDGGAGAVRKEIRARLSYRRGSGRWLLLAGIAPPLATAIAVFTARAAGDGSAFIPSAAIPAMFVVQLRHRRCRRGAWLARLPAASPRQTIWRNDSSVGDGNPMESVARRRLLCSRHAAPDHATTIDSPLRCSVRSLPGVRVQSSRRVRAGHDPGSLVAEHRIGFRRGAAFFDRVLADAGCHIRRACASHSPRVT